MHENEGVRESVWIRDAESVRDTTADGDLDEEMLIL